MISNKPRILILTNAYPTDDTPNKGLDIRDQLRRLNPYFEFKVIYARPKVGRFNLSKTYTKKWYDQDIQVYEAVYPTIPKIGPLINGILYYITLRKLIYSINQKFPLNQLSCYWTYPEGFAASIVKRDLKIPLTIRPRGSDINFFIKYFPFRILIKFCLRMADVIIPVCNDLGKNIVNLEIDPNKVRCVPFGVDTQRFKKIDKNSCREKVGIPFEKFAILFIGNLLEVKGINYLIESLKIIEQKKIKNIELNIIGSGPLKEKYLSAARQFGECAIKLRGEIPHDDIPLWMNASDLFCLPSISEGYPNVLMEALACGLPVIASRVGGIPEIINSEDIGILVPPRDPVMLAEAIISAMERKWETRLLIERGKENCWQKATDRIYNIYKELTE